MSLPKDAVLLPNAVHFREFYGGYTGTCGETALTAALVCAERLPIDHDQAVQMMLSITGQMRAMGWASANGASTLWDLAREASTKRGGQIALEWDYAEPFPHDWHAQFLAFAAHRPIVVQLANAQALPGDERGVHYHFVCIVGRCSEGYIVMDGDNWAIEQDFVVYSYANFEAAQPCGVLILDEKAPPAAPPPPPPNTQELEKELAAAKAQILSLLAFQANAKTALLTAHQLFAPFSTADADIEKVLKS